MPEVVIVGGGSALQPLTFPSHKAQTLLVFVYVQTKERLKDLQTKLGIPEVVVVGGGYAGVELASVAAEMLSGSTLDLTEMKLPNLKKLADAGCDDRHASSNCTRLFWSLTDCCYTNLQ